MYFLEYKIYYLDNIGKILIKRVKVSIYYLDNIGKILIAF